MKPTLAQFKSGVTDDSRYDAAGEHQRGLLAMAIFSVGHLLLFVPRLFENTYFWDDVGWIVNWNPAPFTEVLQYTLHEHWHPVINALAKVSFKIGGADSRWFSSINLISGLGCLWGLYFLLRHLGARCVFRVSNSISLMALRSGRSIVAASVQLL